MAAVTGAVHRHLPIGRSADVRHDTPCAQRCTESQCDTGRQSMSFAQRLNASAALVAASTTLPVRAQTMLAPSPGWVRAMPAGPVTSTRITADYARLVARDAFFWAWPLVN